MWGKRAQLSNHFSTLCPWVSVQHVTKASAKRGGCLTELFCSRITLQVTFAENRPLWHEFPKNSADQSKLKMREREGKRTCYFLVIWQRESMPVSERRRTCLVLGIARLRAPLSGGALVCPDCSGPLWSWDSKLSSWPSWSGTTMPYPQPPRAPEGESYGVHATKHRGSREISVWSRLSLHNMSEIAYSKSPSQRGQK